MSSHTEHDSASSSEYDSNIVECESEEQDEPTVLEYARFYGLCTDYLLEHPCVHNIPNPTIDCFEAGLREPADSSVTNATASELRKERLTITKQAAVLLRTIHPLQQPSDKDLLLPSDNWRRVKILQVEVPILTSDEELDLLTFGCTDTPSFSNLRIPFELVDVEEDEGFEWPMKYYEYPAQCDKQAKAEKLAISRDHLLFLGNMIKDHHKSADSEKIKEDCLNYTRNPAFQPISPPLLPLSPPLTPYVPSSPDNRLELLSEGMNSVVFEAKTLEDSIVRADRLVHQESRNSDAMLLDDFNPLQVYDHFFDDTSSRTPKRKTEDLKMEGPLTPSIFTGTPMKKLKSVSFTGTLHKYLPELPSHYKTGDDISNSEYSFMDVFREQLEDYTNETIQRVENEQLSEVDTTTRVDVPNVDFSLPVAPWKEFAGEKTGKHPAIKSQLEAQMKFLIRVKRYDLHSASSWHGISRLERSLSWTPFPITPTVTVDEKIIGEDILCKMLAELTTGDIATSSTDIWKRDGLCILADEEDSENELETADNQEQNDLNALIRKRKLEMEESEADTTDRKREAKAIRPLFHALPGQPLEGPRAPPREVVQSHHWNSIPPTPRVETESSRRRSPHSRVQRPPKPKEGDNSLMFGGSFSATTALHNFMEIHGKPVPKVKMVEDRTSGAYQQSTSSQIQPMRSASIAEVLEPHAHTRESISLNSPPQLPHLSSVPRHLPPCSFIISTTLLQQRSLTRAIEKLYPNAEFMQRDFTAPHSATGEADLLLSPSTGLILTTLQQIKQRALPGQPDRSPLKERVGKLQYRYERLVVLVSEGLTRDMEEHGSSRPIDNSDKGAITLFENFAGMLEGNVLVEYLRGGEQALAISIVAEMAKWGLPHGSKDIGDLKAVQDEGTWELFLRRAGFNTYAAQVIIGSLQTPDRYPLPFSSSSVTRTPEVMEVLGLTGFILMNAEERVRRFQTLLGGSRILQRVNRVLEQEWPSAVNGFTM